MKTANPTSALYAFAEPDLKQVDKVILSLTKPSEELVFLLSNHLIASGGKRLRPILTIVCAKLCGYLSGERHINLAAAVEFIHTATLLHDDVVDESQLRRGKPTANNKWGNKASILVGDFLLSQAFILMVKDGSLHVLDILASASAVIAEGEVMQLAVSGNIDVLEEVYLKIIKAKTAELFAAACQLGAVVSNQPELERHLRNLGMYLGIAFQIVDDGLDYSARQQELGKEIGNDFREGKVTLPVIHAYKHGDEQEKAFWQRTIKQQKQQNGDLEQAISLINKHGSLLYTIDMAKSYIQKSHQELQVFAPSQAKSVLEDLLDFAVARSY